MFCPSCGKENAQDLGYCHFCGQALTPAPSVAPAAYAPQPGAAPASYPAQIMPGPKKSNSTLIIVIVLVACIFAGAGGWVVANINRQSPEQRISRLMREASGAQPIHNSFFSSDRQFDDNLREQFRNMFHLNQQFMGA